MLNEDLTSHRSRNSTSRLGAGRSLELKAHQSFHTCALQSTGRTQPFSSCHQLYASATFGGVCFFFLLVIPQYHSSRLRQSLQNVCNCCVSMSWHPLLTWFMTFCLSCATCSLSMLAVDASSEFWAFKVFTFSSNLAILSNFLFRHLDAAILFLMRFLSALILSCDSMSIGDRGGVSPGISGTV